MPRFCIVILTHLMLWPMLANALAIPNDEAKKIGAKIWKNECGGTLSGLTAWNEGEEFASMGIAHFIWYPQGRKGPFEEQFPKLLAFFINNGVALPSWLAPSKECPWSSRQSFQQDMKNEKLAELRNLLAANLDLQILFLTKRLEEALPKMTQSLSFQKVELIKKQFYRVANEPNGLYALLDYLNFKGEGSSPQERYQGVGWGLLQVLEEMAAQQQGSALEDFAAAAKGVLARRVANAPPERGEARWIKGWLNRIETYLK